MRPHIYKTNDGGKTWKEIVNGLPDDPINVVKEDPQQKGLLFAGSERAVYVSFDDGDHWQSLRLNMPATSIRDLVIKDDDLVIGTHGRSFWILDDIAPLRQLSIHVTNEKVILYKPQQAIRVRWNMWTDTPLPQEEPAGQNPPDGAIIDYYLNENEKNVSLDILDIKGKLVHHYGSNDTMYEVGNVNIPLYWIRPQQILSAAKGSHRFLWDMHYQPLNLPPSYPIAAIYKNTAPGETSPWVMPGTYTAKLTVDDQSFTEKFIIKMDPRVKTTVADLQKQHDLSYDCYNARKEIMTISNEIANIRSQIKTIQSNANAELLTSLKQADELLAKLQGAPRNSREPGFSDIENTFAALFGTLQETDMPATSQTINAVKETKSNYAKVLNDWNLFKTKQLSELNKQVQAAGLAPLSL
jgi:hypothetical protein